MIRLNRETSASPIKVSIEQAIDPRHPSTIWVHIKEFKFKAGKAQVVTKLDDGSTHLWLDFYNSRQNALVSLLTRAGLEQYGPGKFRID